MLSPPINYFPGGGLFINHSLCFNRIRSMYDNRSGFSYISIEGIHFPSWRIHFFHGQNVFGPSWSTPRIWRTPRRFGFPSNKRGSHIPSPYLFFAATNPAGSVSVIIIAIPQWYHNNVIVSNHIGRSFLEPQTGGRDVVIPPKDYANNRDMTLVFTTSSYDTVSVTCVVLSNVYSN